jgi:molecular chaperone HtpG
MRHPIVQAVARASEAARDDEIADLSALLLDEATILDGAVPDDPAAFAARVNRLVARGLATPS